MTGLHYLEVAELGPLLEGRELSPVELVRHMLARIDDLDGQLRAYARVMADEALAAAATAEAEIGRGHYRGPLHGVPIAVKDLFWTEGTVTAAGTTVFKDFVPREDATVVRRLREAGAIVLGKLQLTEGAFATPHPLIEPPSNPWGREHWTGASSSGSGVAIASGLCFAALGTDTGGSIRFPCAANGVTGLKPTWGAVSRHGSFELAATLDHVGPLARSARDVAIMYEAIAGEDALDPISFLACRTAGDGGGRGVAGLRVGIDRDWNAMGSDAATLAVIDQAIRTIAGQGSEIVDVTAPDAWHIAGEWEVLCGVQTALAHAATYPARAAEYGPALSRLIEVGRSIDGMRYQRAILDALAFSGRMSALLGTIDLLLVPVQPFAAPTHQQLGQLAQDPVLNQRLIQFSSPFNVSGHPALTLPGGMTAGGMPIGFQLIARKGAESLLCSAGEAFQRATDWHRQHPPA